MFKLLTILPCLFMMYQPLNAKVDPPNYNFNLSSFDNLYPNKKISEVEVKLGKGEVMDHQDGLVTRRFIIKELRYQISIFILERDGVIQDTFARLPSYFLHDVFFQSLVNRFGKQTSYKRVGEEAVYEWKKEGLTHVYSAACTITCFPIFYSISKSEGPSLLALMKLKGF